ncbi:ParE family toxin-like protein [Laspinema palackyanum]|uniref:ParE family toxin-like protein n=1 Tax=Laspinema palackyanum TaxID=3231601 RepID=UPI003F541B83
MKSRITKGFRKHLNQLPKSIREQARNAYILWRSDAYHNSLQFKRVNQQPPIYSVRVGLNYRALGLLEEDEIYWFWIGSHAEYDALLKRL